jgi:hypothetical protein
MARISWIALFDATNTLKPKKISTRPQIARKTIIIIVFLRLVDLIRRRALRRDARSPGVSSVVYGRSISRFTPIRGLVIPRQTFVVSGQML